MTKYTLQVDGMMCGMCEAHINDAVRKALPDIKKVTSSHAKKHTVVISEQAVDEQTLRDAIDSTGYTVLSITSEPYEKKRLFSFFHK